MTDDCNSNARDRPGFQEIMLRMAQLVAQRSTCLRLQVGTVISSKDFRQVYSMGYNGNASGLPNASDNTGPEAVGNCGCCHAELNAIVNCSASREVEKLVFSTDSPCIMCAKYLINLGGVTAIYFLRPYRTQEAASLLERSNITLHHVYAFSKQAPVGEEIHGR